MTLPIAIGTGGLGFKSLWAHKNKGDWRKLISFCNYMNMPCCYIIYSPTLDQYYVGASSKDFTERLRSHNTGKYSRSYTSKADDWQAFLVIAVATYSHARKLESRIKSMKSKRYIVNLKKYPEMVEGLKEKTSS